MVRWVAFNRGLAIKPTPSFLSSADLVRKSPSYDHVIADRDWVARNTKALNFCFVLFITNAITSSLIKSTLAFANLLHSDLP